MKLCESAVTPPRPSPCASLTHARAQADERLEG